MNFLFLTWHIFINGEVIFSGHRPVFHDAAAETIDSHDVGHAKHGQLPVLIYVQFVSEVGGLVRHRVVIPCVV